MTMTSTELRAELGISRQTLMIATRRAQEKMRALIAGTDDFPTLQSAWPLSWWEDAIRRDLAIGRAVEADERARRDRYLRKRRATTRRRLRAMGLLR